GTEGDAREGGADCYFSDARSVGSGHAGSGSWTAAAVGPAPGRACAAPPARRSAQGRQQDQRRQERDRQAVARAGEVVEAVVAGLDALPAHVDLRRLVLAARQRGELLTV